MPKGHFKFFNEIRCKYIECEIEEKNENNYLKGVFPIHSTLYNIMHKSQLSSSLNSTKYKIVFLGDSGVGKSSIIDRFVRGEIDQENQPTVGIDFMSRNIMFGGKSYRLQLWDTAGQEKYKSLVPAYLKDANCGFLVFQISRKQSFQNIKHWHNLFKQHSPQQAIVILIANKSDILSLENCDYLESINTFVEQQQIILIEASAKINQNINEMFQKMINKLQGKNDHTNENLEKIDEQTQRNVDNFFLKYNRAHFNWKKKNGCCFF